MNGLVLTILALCTNLTVSHIPSSSCSGFKSVDMSADGKKVVAVGPHGIVQSLDGGLTWNKKNRVSDFEPKGNHSINNFNGDFVHVTCDNTCSKMVITTKQQGGYVMAIICWIGLQMVIVGRVRRGEGKI